MSFDPKKLRVARASSTEFQDPVTTRSIRIGTVEVGGNEPVIIAGPCAVESREQTLELAQKAADVGAHMLRGGAYKPRTSPHSFQGLGEEGLEILAEAREKTGLPVVTEVIDPRLVEQVASYADVLQVGARHMYNTPLLVEVGRAGKPVLLKRSFQASMEEWILAAEYIAHEGNLDVMLCERGIRTFSNGAYNRNTLDLGILQPVRELTFLPVLVDPSHAVGRADLVPWACHSAIACGAHGLLVEMIGEKTDRAAVKCDGEQGIRPSVLAEVVYGSRTCRLHALHLLATARTRHPDAGCADASSNGNMPPCAAYGGLQQPAQQALGATAPRGGSNPFKRDWDV